MIDDFFLGGGIPEDSKFLFLTSPCYSPALNSKPQRASYQKRKEESIIASQTGVWYESFIFNIHVKNDAQNICYIWLETWQTSVYFADTMMELWPQDRFRQGQAIGREI